MTTLIKNRIAVSGLFLMNGFLYASWTSRLPELQKQFGINNAALGTVLFCIALGSMIAMPVSGWLASKFGSAKMTILWSALFILSVPFIAMFQNIWTVRLTFFVFGICTGSMDITMNAQAVLVERLWGKSIFSSFHAIFSIGMTLGAVSGSLFSKNSISLTLHLLYVVAMALVLLLWCAQHLIKDAPATKENSTGITLQTFKVILPFGIMALCCMTGEGSMVDWSAIFAHKAIGQSLEVSSWALGTFGIAMTLGRTVGDYFINKWGKFTMLVFDAAVATTGMCIMIGFTNVYVCYAGIFLIGTGLSTIVPIVFSSAGNIKGIAPSLGISVASSIGYAGFFVGPPVIGYLSEAYEMRPAFGFVLLLFVVLISILPSVKKLVNSLN